MEFKNKENKCYKTVCGKTIWHSRNVATSICILRTKPEDQTKIQVLGVKRGKSMSHPGKFCFPCGFLDWDETVPQAAVREIYEEAGLEVDLRDLDFVELDSNPQKFSQNVTVHFVLYYTGDQEVSNKNAAQDEIEEVKWFDFEEAEKEEWAFDHKERIETLVKNIQ